MNDTPNATDGIANEIEQAADDRNLSVSVFYTLAAEELTNGGGSE